VATLRASLVRQLPEFMIPTSFVVLDTLPQTPNGKIDRRALPSPDTAVQPVREHVAPRNATEAELEKIWRDVLGRNSFGVTDNFFDLGGHSLLATQLVWRIESSFGIELPLPLVFEATTIEEQSKAIAARRGNPVSTSIPKRLSADEASELLRRIDSLSDAEVEELLRQPALNTFSA
jgi:acyl carrier protein